MKKQTLLRWAGAFLLSLLVLLFCTKSSPLYPINDWADANVYLTVGKGMTQGKVVYRDLYDHKGPLIYALHALCALISFDSFAGVFVMEVLFAAWWLREMHRLCEGFGLSDQASWTATVLSAVLVLTSFSFAEGDSAEELALPFITATMALALPRLQERLSAKRLIWLGFMAGCVFWLKFTMLGLQAGLLLALLLCAKEKGRVVGWLAAGFGLATLPWVVYFGLNGAIGDWLKVYFGDNLLYGAQSSGVRAMLKSGWDWFGQNLYYAPLALAGVLCSLRMEKRQALAVWLAAALGALGAFVGGKSYIYYGLILGALTPLAFVAAARASHKPMPKNIAAIVCAGCVLVCPVMTRNPDAGYGVTLGQPREETMQYRIAAHIEEGAELLNYGFMDAGFYTATGTVPAMKYFHLANVPLEEMKDEQFRYMTEGVYEYVIAPDPPPALLLLRNYTGVVTVQSPNFWYPSATLFRLEAKVNRSPFNPPYVFWNLEKSKAPGVEGAEIALKPLNFQSSPANIDKV